MKWNLELSDHVSGPALSIKSNLEGVAKAFELINKAEKAINDSKSMAAMASRSKIDLSRFQSEASAAANLASHAGITSLEAQIGKIKPSLFSKLTNGIGSIFGEEGTQGFLNLAQAAGKADTALAGVGMSLGGVVAGGAAVAVGAIAGVAFGLYELLNIASKVGITLSQLFTKQVISVGQFRENSLVGLEVMLKSRDKASQVYADAVKMAARTPFETTDIIPLFQQLLAAGFKENELKSVATTIGDMAASKNMDKQVMDRLIFAFGRLKSGKGLSTEVLNMFTENGVNRSEVIAELSKVMKKSTTEVEKLLSTGKISSDVAQNALLTVINAKFGGTMDKMSKALAGLWSTLVSRPFDIFNKALDDKNSGIGKFYNVIKDTVKYFGDAFDPDTNASGKFIAVLNVIGNTFANIGKIVSAFGIGMFEGFSKAMPDLSKTNPANVDKIAKSFGLLGTAIGTVCGYTIAATTAIAEFIANHKTLLQVITTVVGIITVVFAVLAVSLGVVLAGIVALVVWIVGNVLAVFLAIPTAIVAVCGVITAAFVAAFGYAAYYVYTSIDSIKAAISSIVSIVSGLYAGLYAAAASLGSAITNGINSTLDLTTITNKLSSLVPGDKNGGAAPTGGKDGSGKKSSETAFKSSMPPNSELGFGGDNANSAPSYDNSKTTTNSVSIVFQAGSIVANGIDDLELQLDRIFRSKKIMLGNA